MTDSTLPRRGNGGILVYEGIFYASIALPANTIGRYSIGRVRGRTGDYGVSGTFTRMAKRAILDVCV
jgi:hypothetical protein